MDYFTILLFRLLAMSQNLLIFALVNFDGVTEGAYVSR